MSNLSNIAKLYKYKPKPINGPRDIKFFPDFKMKFSIEGLDYTQRYISKFIISVQNIKDINLPERVIEVDFHELYYVVEKTLFEYNMLLNNDTRYSVFPDTNKLFFSSLRENKIKTIKEFKKKVSYKTLFLLNDDKIEEFLDKHKYDYHFTILLAENVYKHLDYQDLLIPHYKNIESREFFNLTGLRNHIIVKIMQNDANVLSHEALSEFQKKHYTEYRVTTEVKRISEDFNIRDREFLFYLLLEYRYSLSTDLSYYYLNYYRYLKYDLNNNKI